MPLVIFSGLPCSGKSTRAKDLASKLQERISSLDQNQPGSNLKVILHSDESLGISEEEYRESKTEKSLRGLQMSAVKRDISRNNIVILDSPAYIKGFRYQLHCEAKALSTACCVIHVMAPLEICLKWNSERPEKDQWDPELLKQLTMRYEEPDGNSRWDSPLIPIAYDDSTIPFDDIWNTLIHSKPPQANAATLMKPATQTNYLQELDKSTQFVINKIIEFEDLQTGRIKIDEDLFLSMPTQGVSVAKLQRIRRTFVTLNRVRSLDIDRIVPLFVDYLHSNLNRDD